MKAKAKPRPEPKTFECGRCGQPHNGERPAPDWSEHDRFGPICGSCTDILGLSAVIGIPVDPKPTGGLRAAA